MGGGRDRKIVGLASSTPAGCCARADRPGAIVATVYGRFHYAVDAIAGVGLALIVVGLYRIPAAHRTGQA